MNRYHYRMKVILGLIAIILALAFAGLLLPAIIGIVAGIYMISVGKVIGGIVAIVVGIGINVIMIYGGFAEGPVGRNRYEEECPYCGSGDIDGNHCYTCNDDF